MTDEGNPAAPAKGLPGFLRQKDALRSRAEQVAR